MADGKVRCGYCMNVFMGGDYLISGAQEQQDGLADENVLRSLLESESNQALDDIDAVLAGVATNSTTEAASSSIEPDLSLLDGNLRFDEDDLRGSSDEDWALELLAELEADNPAALPSKLADAQHDGSVQNRAIDDLHTAQTVNRLEQVDVGATPADSSASDPQSKDVWDPLVELNPFGDQKADEQSEAPKTTSSSAGLGFENIVVDTVPQPPEESDDTEALASDDGAQTEGDRDRRRQTDFLPQHIELDETPQTTAAEVESRIQWQWIGGALGMVLLFIAQYSYFYWDDLLVSSNARPMLTSACRLMGCELPVFRDLQMVSTDQLTVRSHPDVESALIVDIIVTNKSKWSQPFPVLQLTFFDIRSQPVASRKFFPSEYLDGELRGLALMPIRSPIRLALEILDPGADAINYELNLLPSL